MDNAAKSLETVSKIAKTYLRVSYIKTALSIFVVGYTAIKAFALFRQ